MNSYDVRVTTIDGHVFSFEVSASNEVQAKKFATSTAVQVCKNRGIVSKIKDIDVEEAC